MARIYPSDKIKSPVHLSIGQEAVSTGVCDVLRADDVVSGTYRGHALYLAKGGDLGQFMAELYGKATGCALGRGGSMHLVDMTHNVLGASAVVGTTIPVAVGYAMALQREGRRRVVVSVFGDGATEEGAFYESLNFAALHRLPVLFVCENNQYAIHTPLSKRWSSTALVDRVRTFGIAVDEILTGDVLAIRERAAAAVEGLRRGEGPAFLHCLTYRWREHVGPSEDYDSGYRDRDELTPWEATDPVVALGDRLEPVAKAEIDARIEADIADAVAFAEKSPFPPSEELAGYVYA